jgi:spore germination protein GerM
VRWRRILGPAAVGALVVVLGACGIPTDDEPRAARTEDVPFGLLDPPSSTTSSTLASSPDTVAVRVCLLRADGNLAPVSRDLPLDSALADVVRDLGGAPSDAERALGLSTALGDDAVVNSVRVDAGVANVDLGEDVVAGSARNQLEVVAQIVCTLTQQPGVGQVRFLVDGVAVEVARGDGSTTSEPLSRADYANLIPS